MESTPADGPSLYERVAGWFERHRFGTDLTVAAIAAFSTIPGGYASADMVAYGTDQKLPALFLAGWAGLMTVPFVWARTRPVAASAALFALAMGHMAFGQALVFPVDAMLPYALYGLTAHGPRWAPLTGIVAAVVGCLAFSVSMSQMYPDDPYGSAATAAVFAFFTFLTAWALGLFRRSRRMMLEALRDRAERLELERDQQAQIASAAERARIAREMHDVVAHSLSVVIAQADGGRYAAVADPAAAERTLTTISETGRAALADMRGILGVLRTGRASGAPAAADVPGRLSTSGRHVVPEAPRANVPGPPYDPDATHPRAARRPQLAPQPDAGQIEALVAQTRDRGMRVSFARVGQERPLPAGIGLNLYRIAQESLTNVRKHAGPDPRVSVMMRWDAAEVELVVTDDGRGLAAGEEPAAPGSGFGLVGMRERAELIGGDLDAGPLPGGGFRVRFVVPMPDGSEAGGDAEVLQHAEGAEG